MTNQSLKNLKSILAICTSLALTACGGGGGDSGTGVTPVARTVQNVVYLDDNTNQSLLAAFDDGSASPFSLLDVNGGSIARNSISLSPDGQHVAFNVISGNNTSNLYISHVNGAYYTQVTSLSASREVTQVAWSPDSTRLVYLADANRDNQYELFMTTAAFDSTADISASNELISGTVTPVELDIASPSWSPDGSKVAYTVTNETYRTPNQVIGVNYHDTRIGNRHSVRLSTPVNFPSYQDIPDYAWSADGLHLAYRSDDSSDGLYRVFKIDFTTATPSISANVPPAGSFAESYAFSADSQHIATVTRTISGAILYRLAVAASGAGVDVFKAESIQNPMRINWANKSASLAFSASDQSGTGHLYQLDMNSGNITLLSTTTQANEIVDDFDWSPSDDYLGYTSTRGLYLVTPSAPSPQLVHDISIGIMDKYQLNWPWSHNGDRLAYSVGSNAGNTTSLFVYKLATPNQAIEVAGPFATGTFISRSVWSQDDARLAFKSFQAGCNSELYTTSSTGHNVILIPADECQSNFAY
jgi:Tol biopolymer transport system component